MHNSRWLSLIRPLAGAALVSTLAACGPAAEPTAVDEAAPETMATPATDAGAVPAEAGGPGATIRIGSKNFTESYIVAEVYAQALENAGYVVERKLDLGATDIAHAALERGDIDLYPEYTSTGLLTVLKAPAMTDAAAIYQAVKDGYAEQFNLVWLDPAPFNNPQALATTAAIAQERGIRTYSDLAAQAGDLRLGAPPEFVEREDGLAALQAAYGGFTFGEVKQLDPGLRYPALENGDVDVVVAFGTDGQISGLGLALLEDDLGLYPPYQSAPVVRRDVLDANPGLADVLNSVSPLMTTEVMQAANWRVDGPEKAEPADVAAELLSEHGFAP